MCGARNCSAAVNQRAIVPFDALVGQVMEQAPYASARRVFWIVDNGSSHRGRAAAARLTKRWPNLILVHLPIHASWLNQIEIIFSILQRKVLVPNAFESLFELEDCILTFQQRYQECAKPFDWKYTRDDLARLLARLRTDSPPLAIPA
jgi:transposase